jgi:hypothetical protein
MIVVSPTARWLKLALLDCSISLTVSSPYIGNYFADTVASLPPNISVTLLTRTLITDFASRASDLDAVCQLAKRSDGLLSLSSLHAKVYVVDQTKALVTSANATFSGMHRNRECGLEVTSLVDIRALVKLIQSGFGGIPKPKHWTAEDLEELREPVRVLRAALPRSAKQRLETVEAPPRVELPRRQFNKLIESFSGWLRLTLEGIAQIESDIFTMEQVWIACAPLAKKRFPHNQHSREKLRQQMQRLRDLGLVLFLDRGRYERLANAR